MTNRKIEEVIALSVIIGGLEFILLPIAIGWGKNPFTIPDFYTRVILTTICGILPILGYLILRWEWKERRKE